ncbi:uncharacterized protein LOC124851113 isoform X2 [Hippoglossus stenolepis]|uniref:uncharacterized protein LOC124851113 isoform X2 n=1 Tax=Hippoglossus stenolepis TaxID=195615 RepID=UPI001FAF33BC|nr:uncharacterized protein LOC124851113 isoform X2 [Hippoglossus stenolepis]
MKDVPKACLLLPIKADLKSVLQRRRSTSATAAAAAAAAARDEMILNLLLITTISCVCGNFFVKVKQTDYQAEENDSVTLEWTFTTRSDKSPNLLMILCNLVTDHRVSVVYRLHDGVEVPEDEQFSGRVQCDRDVLREGRLRLHVSRLRTEDSGQYKCVVSTRYGQSADKCWLNVTATVAQEQHTTTTVNPEPLGQERFYISLGAGIMTAVIIIVIIVAMTATLLGMQEYTAVITVIVVIAVLFSIAVVVCSITAATAAVTAGLLSGGSILFAVFVALSAYCIPTCSSVSPSNSESGSDSSSSSSRYKMCPTKLSI